MLPRLHTLRVVAISMAFSAFVQAEDVPHLSFAPPQPFSYETLIAQARELATKDFQDTPVPEANLVEQIDYLQHGRIRFKREAAIWIGDKKQFAISFFHVGLFFKKPVGMYLVDKGQAREILASKDVFDIPKDSPAHQMESDHRIAGFKIQEDKNGSLDWKTNDWMSFLGASYFRTIGELYQYGLSARGIAVNTANPYPPFNEEFPNFTSFWMEESSTIPNGLVMYALLDGPSLTGAFRFEIERKKKVVMNVQATLFLRKDIRRLGIAPLTSMYWFSETAKPAIVDWRPEVHDSDGLSINTGDGRWLWRPLNNPSRIRISSFMDENPKGFGLMQRDRDFFSYVEEGGYEKRPSLWVEPVGNWGRGAVELVELPTDDESEDNIVAFWVPAEPMKAGSEHTLNYKMIWMGDEPKLPTLGRCIATRLVREPMKHWDPDMQKFVIEFSGGPLSTLPKDAHLDADIWTSRGRVGPAVIESQAVDGGLIWRVKFALNGWQGNSDPIEMGLTLKKDGKAVSESWLYQFNP